MRIPRIEVDEILRIVRVEAVRLVPGTQCVVCGSYRRGNLTCGDVDILLAPPDSFEDNYIVNLMPLLDRLEHIGFLTDHLALPTATPSSDEDVDVDRESYMGVCRLPAHLYEGDDVASDAALSAGSMAAKALAVATGESTGEPVMVGKLMGPRYHRRIDIKSYPRKMFPFALLYFTGSDYFNRYRILPFK